MAVKVEIFTMNRLELKNKSLQSRKVFFDEISKINPERMELIILHGEWSVKDLIGHICEWENRVVDLLEILRVNITPEPIGDIDALNQAAIQEYRLLSVDVVQEMEQKAFQRVLSILDAGNDDELFGKEYFPWAEGRSFAEFICDNTWGHFEEHLPEVTAWLKRIA